MSVGLVVNSYERTYRDVLRPGFFSGIVAQNLRPLDEVVALINNVDDVDDARDRAESLVRDGEITSYALVSDHIDEALAGAKLSRRVLRVRPYLLDYGLVMPRVVATDWLVGWDAETRLSAPTNWVDPAIALLDDDLRVFHVSLNWPPARPQDAGLEGDVVAWVGDFALSWGFSDQLFLLRRKDLLGPIYRSFSPAAIARHAPHPYTFEFRVESFQRATGRFRATLSTVSYQTNQDVGGVLVRTGESTWDAVRRQALHRLEHGVTRRLPPWIGPRFARNSAPAFGRVPERGRVPFASVRSTRSVEPEGGASA